MLPLKERVTLARELTQVRTELREKRGDVAARVKLARRIDAIRKALRGQGGSGLDDLDLFGGQASAARLLAYWESLKDKPDIERMRAAKYLALVAGFVSSTSNLRAEPGSPIKRLIDEVVSAPDDAGNEAEREHFMAQAADIDGAIAKTAAAREKVRLLDLAEADAARQRKEAAQAVFNEYLEKDRALGRELRALHPAITDRDPAKQAEHEKASAALFDEYEQLRKDTIERFKPLQESIVAARGQANAEVLETTIALRRSILDASPITEEKAAAFAKSQTIEPGAKAALKRLKYRNDNTTDPIEAVQQDIAEFYRMTGGRIPSVTIRASRSKRASAEGIHGHRNRIINMGQRFDKRVLWHELGHHLEADPQVLAAARGFLAKRRESPEKHKLSKLTGWKGYGPREVAYKDAWFDPYVGKVYPDATEVFSMGVESWATPSLLANRMAQDPEHFKLISGFFKAPPHELYGVLKRVLADANSADEQAQEEADDLRERAYAVLAAEFDRRSFVEPVIAEMFKPGGVGSEDRGGMLPYWVRGRETKGIKYVASITATSDIRIFADVPGLKDYAGGSRTRKGFVIYAPKENRHISGFDLAATKAEAFMWAEEGAPQWIRQTHMTKKVIEMARQFDPEL